MINEISLRERNDHDFERVLSPEPLFYAMEAFERGCDNYAYGDIGCPSEFLQFLLTECETYQDTENSFYQQLTLAKDLLTILKCSQCGEELKRCSYAGNQFFVMLHPSYEYCEHVSMCIHRWVIDYHKLRKSTDHPKQDLRWSRELVEDDHEVLGNGMQIGCDCGLHILALPVLIQKKG
jgi:hypothetical protein